MLAPDIYEYLIKMLLSMVLGGLIGIEREITHHWAGLRTHILVCLGATMFMFITSFQYVAPQVGVNINIDATRLAAGVIMGIGFLGAGVIFKEGVSVKGLTTAASIWVTAAVGLLVGIGKYELAVIATILILIVLYSDFILEKKLFRSREIEFLNITINRKPDVQDRIEKILRSKRSYISLKDFKRDKKTVSFVYTVILSKVYREKITRLMLKDPDIIGLSWTE